MPIGRGARRVAVRAWIGSLVFHALIALAAVWALRSTLLREQGPSGSVDLNWSRARGDGKTGRPGTGPETAQKARRNENESRADGGSALGATSGLEKSPSGGSQNALEQVRAAIADHLRYPISLQRRGVVGEVALRIGLDAQGALKTLELGHSSGSRDLDELALEAARAAAPFAPPGREVDLTVPVVFKLGMN